MWIPIEAVKYVDDDTRRLSNDVSSDIFDLKHIEKNMEPKIGRTARAPLKDTNKHKIGVSKTCREDQIKCDSGGARSARKCSVRTCNPRAQWTSRVGPHILHIEENTVHEDFSCPRRRSAHNCRSSVEGGFHAGGISDRQGRHACHFSATNQLEKSLPLFAEVPSNEPKMVHYTHWKKGLF